MGNAETAMPTLPMAFSGTVRILRHVGIWSLVGLFIASQTMMTSRYLQNESPTWTSVMVFGLAVAHFWGVCSLLIRRIVTRYPLDRRFLIRGGIAHAGLLGAITFGYGIVGSFGYASEMQGETFIGRWFFCVSITFHAQLLIYVVITAWFYALEYYRQSRTRERKLAQMQVELSQARLDKLRSQIHPHFLFNTLNTVTALINDDPDNAILVTARLSDLLRIALESGDRETVELREELSFISKYVDIQQIRFGPRLEYALDTGDGIDRALVPALMLQPLVENGIMHGMEFSTDICRISIKAQKRGDQLWIEVTNSGPGCNGLSSKSNMGIGLANSRKRLECLYGVRGNLDFVTCNTAGAKVALTIPLQFNSNGGETE